MDAMKIIGEPLLHVDATPDERYPIRILRAHLENTKQRWASRTDGQEETNPLCVEMNKMQDKRAEILLRAIKILEKALKGD